MTNLYSGFILLLINANLLIAGSATEEYNIRNIPAGLRKTAHVVVRKYIDEFEVMSYERAVLYHTEAYTIYGKDEQHHGELSLPYNSSFEDIDDLEGYIYDAKGEVIYELDEDDITDFSNFMSYSLYSDIRIKSAALYHNTFPYTVEFKYTSVYKGYLNWPDWYSRYNYNPVQLSRFIIKIPDTLRYWCNSDMVKPVVEKNGFNLIYYWEAINLPELPVDRNYDDPQDYAVHVIISPGSFNLDGYDGNMSSWKDLGLWVYKLYSGGDPLSETAVSEIKKQYNETDNIYDKIQKLYRYMQKRTRYVSIQLGIGGWKPFDASFVHEKGYGDCKALSNYMCSILEISGIKAYPTLIYRGSGHHFIKEFPSNQFNHVVVCILLPEDTVWLECTSQTMMSNNIGTDNQNRFGLMITPEGGKIINTPVSDPEDNKQVRRSEVKLFSLTPSSAEMKVTWTGGQRDYNNEWLNNAPEEEKSKRIAGSMNLPDVRLKNFSLDRSKSDELSLTLTAELPGFTSGSSTRIFFKPNLTERRTSVPREVNDRLSSIKYEYPFEDIDTIQYHIPDGYTVETLPDKIDIETSFGKYKAVCNISDNKIIYTRYYEISNYEIPAAHYDEYRKFHSAILNADRSQVVLIKKQLPLRK